MNIKKSLEANNGCYVVLEVQAGTISGRLRYRSEFKDLVMELGPSTFIELVPEQVKSVGYICPTVKEGVLYYGEVMFHKYEYLGHFALIDGRVYCFGFQPTKPKIEPGGWEWYDECTIGRAWPELGTD